MDLGIPRDWANWISAHIGFELVIPAFYAWVAGGLLTAITIADMAAIPKATWRSTSYPVRAMRWAARVGLIVVPVGLAASLLWWGRIARSLRPPVAPNSPTAFTAAWHRTRLAGGRYLMAAGFFGLMFGFAHSLTPDPDSIYIDQLGREIEPRTYIATHCPDSVAKVGHLDTRSFSGDDKFERWDVTPLPGHVDVVLLNLTTGAVICP